MKKIKIFGGGTINHVRSHLALCAPAYGNTAQMINEVIGGLTKDSDDFKVEVNLSRMSNPENYAFESNDDLEILLKKSVEDPDTKIIFMSAAVCDFNGHILDEDDPDESVPIKYSSRLQSENGYRMLLEPANKLIGEIRKYRKDIFLVGFKTTCGATEDEQFLYGLQLLKKNSCNLVLANDVKTRSNMVITPEQARYSFGTDRNKAIEELCKMSISRSKLRFTRSKVVEGETTGWNSEKVPSEFRKVVNFCIQNKAYKPFLGSTVGHFAIRGNEPGVFYTSIRKTNFNRLDEVGLTKVETIGNDSVISVGHKPSVGGQSQRMIFDSHPDVDCIVHFHCPLKENPRDKIPVRSQWEYECGSHECGQNTRDGLRDFNGILAVMLENHGPNIVFSNKMDSEKVIDFIQANFDLSRSTDKIDREFLSNKLTNKFGMLL